jgi:hypothetical protein
VFVALPLLLLAGQDSTWKRHSVWLRLLWSLYAVVPTCVVAECRHTSNETAAPCVSPVFNAVCARCLLQDNHLLYAAGPAQLAIHSCCSALL